MRPDFLCPRATIIDCGASRTALGVFSSRGDRLRLDDYAVEIFPATSGREDDWAENTRAALLKLRARVKVSGPVVLVLPPHLALTKHIATPRVAPARRAKVIQFEAAQNFPYALADVAWGSVVAGERPGDLAVLLAAAKLDTVGPLCAAVQAAGFEPGLILPAPLATLAAFRLVHPTPPGSALVLNLGARSTTLLLTAARRFAVRTFPPGGSSVTRQIAECQDCDSEDAEAIKLSDERGEMTADAKETLVTRLAQEITRSVLHFRRQEDLGPPGCIHLTGGGACLAGLAEALAARLKVPVDRLDVLNSIEIASETVRREVTAHAGLLADLAGAAATQLRTEQPALDLLPPKLRRQAGWRRRQPWLLAAAALAVAALLPPVLHYRAVTAEARRKTAAMERAIAPLRERDARNRAGLLQLAELQRQVAALRDVHDRRVGWLKLFADLQERFVRVEDVWLEKLTVTPPASGAPLRLHVSGRMLDRTNPFSKVSLETTNRVKALLRDIDSSPYVRVAEEGRRFDNSQPGILKFDFTLTANPARPL